MWTGHVRPWRRGSDYAAPPRNQLDRGQRHVWRRRVVAEARVGNLPGKAILVAEALLACLGQDGELYPSQATIAAKAGVGIRTVTRHVNAMMTLGLIQKHRRLVRVAWPEGGRGAVRVQQTSNAYVLAFPAGAVLYRPRVKGTMPRTAQQAAITNVVMVRGPHDTAGHTGPEEADNGFNYYSTLDRTTALAALEAVRVAREVANASRWWAMRR